MMIGQFSTKDIADGKRLLSQLGANRIREIGKATDENRIIILPEGISSKNIGSILTDITVIRESLKDVPENYINSLDFVISILKQTIKE